MKYTTCIILLFLATHLLGFNSSDTIYFERLQLENDISIPNITHINHDIDGNLWISTSEGLYRFDGYDVTKYVSTENESHGLVKDKVNRTHLSQDSTLWIVGAYSIYTYDPLTERIVRMSEDARKIQKDLYDISYFDIEDIDARYMALGTKSGLWIYDKDSKKMIVHDSLVQDFKVDRYSTNAHVLQIERDPVYPHQLWLLTKSGLFTFDCLTRESTQVIYDKDVGFESLKDRGFSMYVSEDHIYFLVNYLKLFKYEVATKKVTRLKQNFKRTTSHHMRNILPYEDGFLIVYMDHGLHHYSLKNDEIKPFDNLYADNTICNGMSYVGFDHEGKYAFISNIVDIVKSKEKITPIANTKRIFTKNLSIENYRTLDTIKNNKVHTLESYERNIKFDVGLTNRNNGDVEHYFYRESESENWFQLSTNHIELNNLSAGKHTIYLKIESNGKSYEDVVKRFEIKPYFYETTWFVLLILFSLIGVASIISYLVKIRQSDKKEYQKRMLELEMSALRSQMNPHFLFNSINSIKSYVVSKNKEEAAEYLTQFAKLIRMILENSRKKYLTLEEEIEMLKLYVIMEQKRLNFSFDFEMNIDPEIDSNFLIAPMLIQPYIENAIWHGLMNKYGDKKLTLEIVSQDDGVLCTVLDNGIGRVASNALQNENTTSKKSLGLKITEDRISIIRKMYKINASIDVIDLYDEDGIAIGTEVKILLPTINEMPPL